ncbi:hypothetical protein D3C83_223450 [compost metagenome]
MLIGESAKAVPVTGGLMLELLTVDGAEMPHGPSLSRGTPRRPAVARHKASSAKRKVQRKRR